MSKNDNGVALITGASSGIGRVTALALKQAGYHVFGTSRKAAPANTDGITMLVCDVTDEASVQKTVDEVVKQAGRIDLLVNNAGVGLLGGAEESSVAQAQKLFDVNVFGVLRVTNAVLPVMRAQRQGRIINMSSINAIMAIPAQLAYVTSKGALAQLTKAMALGLAPHGIRVNAIGPGTIATDILKGVMTDDQARNRILSRTPLGRFGEPEEIAKVAVFLAGDDASYITGQTIYPDGGRLALNYTVPVG